MNKLIPTIIGLALCTTSVRAQDSTDYPALQDWAEFVAQNPTYLEPDATAASRSEYNIMVYTDYYLPTVTVDRSIPTRSNIIKDPYWETAVTDSQAYAALDQIKSTIHATQDLGTGRQNKATTVVSLLASEIRPVRKISRRQMAENPNLRDGSELDQIHLELESYQLSNENGNEVKIQDYEPEICKARLTKVEGIYYHGLCRRYVYLEPPYLALQGQMTLNIQVPAGWAVQAVTRADVGQTFEIAGNTVKLLAFESDALHYQILKSGNPIKVESTLAPTDIIEMSFATYDAYRRNPHLSLSEFVRRSDEIYAMKGVQGKDKNAIGVIRFDGYAPEQVYIVAPRYLEDTQEVPVDIH